MDFTKQVNKLNTEITLYSNKVAQQQFEELRDSIIKTLEKRLNVRNLEAKIIDLPKKKGRPPIKKNVYIRLKNRKNEFL